MSWTPADGFCEVSSQALVMHRIHIYVLTKNENLTHSNPENLVVTLLTFEHSADIESWPYSRCALMHCPAGISFSCTAQILTMRHHFTQIR